MPTLFLFVAVLFIRTPAAIDSLPAFTFLPLWISLKKTVWRVLVLSKIERWMQSVFQYHEKFI